ncbi:4727_t:CDS:10 [Diversispora eburnea]|uniref:4727_t:CDS:1 n=1 Tax=Diversispora eburnea TaxID=1213867 RepID=A0A9N8V2M1_9GLOM|nr:4727_t:CDS:10 [Diversispora eburnea]
MDNILPQPQIIVPTQGYGDITSNISPSKEMMGTMMYHYNHHQMDYGNYQNYFDYFNFDQIPCINFTTTGNLENLGNLGNLLDYSHSSSLLNDVFFSDPMIDDDDSIELSLQFDSDASSDTDILTPYNSPSSPAGIIDGGDDIWRLFYEDEFVNELRDQPSFIITRPNYFEFGNNGDNLISPPPPTPELVSDNNLKPDKKIRIDEQNGVKSSSSTKSVILGKGLTKAKSTSQKTKKGKSSIKRNGSKVSTPNAISSPASTSSTMMMIIDELQETEELEVTLPRPTQTPTVFENLTKSGIDWCRYCGTTEGVNWRPGPWGKRTLCNKHGCDYKGYGFACKLPRLDLTGFVNETVEERELCTVCQKQESFVGNVLVRCEGCPKAFHQKCFVEGIDDETVQGTEPWYCEKGCQDNLRRKRIVVELPRKRLPLMSTPKAQIISSTTDSSSIPNSGTTSRPRTSRNSSRV